MQPPTPTHGPVNFNGASAMRLRVVRVPAADVQKIAASVAPAPVLQPQGAPPSPLKSAGESASTAGAGAQQGAAQDQKAKQTKGGGLRTSYVRSIVAGVVTVFDKISAVGGFDARNARFIGALCLSFFCFYLGKQSVNPIEVFGMLAVLLVAHARRRRQKARRLFQQRQRAAGPAERPRDWTDAERSVFLNKRYEQVLNDMLGDTLQSVVNDYRPFSIEEIVIRSVEIGNKPPKIHSVKGYQGAGTDLAIEADVQLIGSLKALLGLRVGFSFATLYVPVEARTVPP
eukprot:tig00020902_g14966.t1